MNKSEKHIQNIINDKGKYERLRGGGRERVREGGGRIKTKYRH